MLKIRPITELMMMSAIGLMATLYESSSQNMNNNIREVWATPFHGFIGTEGITKSVMTAIALARGLTVHIYIAAYALMFYPFLFERGITLLLFWMLICAVRSVIVNMVALVTGCIICSSHTDLKPVCFEFGATKAIELACSVYMWLSVNDFHIRLRSRRRSIIARRMQAKTTHMTDSDLSLLSSEVTVASYMDFDEDEADSSDDSMIVKAAVSWLIKSAFGTKYENHLVEVDVARTQRFLNMTVEELKELQNRIKDKLYEEIGEQPPKFEHKLVESDTDGTLESQPSTGEQSEPLSTIPQTQNEDISYQKTETQSIGSQTKKPSKKLQERLSKEAISPKGSETLESARKTSSSERAQVPRAQSSTGLNASRDVSAKSQEIMNKAGSSSPSKENDNVRGILIDPETRKNEAAVEKKVEIKKKQ